MGSRFTQKAELALNKSVIIAEELGHTYVGTEHVLLAMAEDDTSCASMLLKKNGVHYDKLYEAIKGYCGTGKKTHLNSKDTTPRCRKILENSYKNAQKFMAERIGTEHLLLAIIDEKDSVALKILQKIAIDNLALRDDILTFSKSNQKALQARKNDIEPPLINLNKYGKNMTDKAKKGMYDPVIGREKETDRIIRILSRKNKNNPCLIGEAGVGKTAIVEGLANMIATRQVPNFLLDKKIYSLDLTSMIAGAKYRGDFEERIKSILDEVKSNTNIILFIDEIHSIVGAGSAEGAIDAANIMKPELARGDIQIIGATTYTEYKKFIEKDNALERRFQPIIVDEPSRERTISILNGIKEKYENHHNVTINDSAIESAVDLSLRYINDRFLPDKAIDLLDEACAKARIDANNSIFIKKQEDNIKHFAGITEIVPEIYIDSKDHKELFFAQNNNHNISRPEVDFQNILEVVEEITGTDLSKKPNTSLHDDIFSKLSDNVVGQECAVKSLVSNIVRGMVGIINPDRPKGIFLFLGQSGVGKTKLAKATADAIFNTEDALIRLDMSEFSESYSTSKLIGSAPGYVGYDDSDTIFEKIRKAPYSVILLDEIEKAHPDVLSLFLQIFDYGFIKDSSGRNINFRNTYIIMTSNVGADWNKTLDIGFNTKNDSNCIDYENKLKDHFKQEFINRIDSIIHFNKLSIENLASITRQKLNDVVNRIKKYPLSINIDEDVIHYIAKETNKKDLGARPIEKIIANKIEFPLARLIIENENELCDSVSIYISNGEISVSRNCPLLQK